MHTVPGYPTYMRESETPHTGEVQRQKGGLRYVRAGDEERCLGGFKGSLQDNKMNKRLVNKSLFCIWVGQNVLSHKLLFMGEVP